MLDVSLGINFPQISEEVISNYSQEQKSSGKKIRLLPKHSSLSRKSKENYGGKRFPVIHTSVGLVV